MSEVTHSKPVSQVSPTDPKKDRPYESADHKDAEDQDPPHEENRRIDDIAFILGVPTADISPDIQKGLSTVMNEFDRQRRELDSMRKRVAFLEKKYDAHPFLPIMSRHALERTITKVLNRVEQAETENCFIYFELEGLESIRRTEGLSVVDLIITNTANMIKATLRASDSMGSMGGYGLGVIFTVTAYDGAEETVEELVPDIEGKLRATYTALRLVYGIYPMQPGDTVTHIFAAADADLRKRSSAD